jgi:DNA repair ATPase RecN
MNRFAAGALIAIGLGVALWFLHTTLCNQAIADAKAVWERDQLEAVNKQRDANEQTQKAMFRKIEIQEANRAKERDRMVVAERAAVSESERLRDALARVSAASRDATDASGTSSTCTAALELFREANAEAEHLAQEAGRLALQAAGLQTYGQACYSLTNAPATPRHDVENHQKEHR